MDKEFEILLLEEKDTSFIINYLEQVVNLKNKEDNPHYITYINENVITNEYYSSKKIRERKCNFIEEYILLKKLTNEISGIITFSVEGNVPVLNLNLIYICVNDLQRLRNCFINVIDNIKNNTIIVPSKIRAALIEENYNFNKWSDMFLSLGFEVEAIRKYGVDFKQNCIDYVYHFVGR